MSNIFCEFFEVVVHNILYQRKLYPSSTFVPKRKYGIVVYENVHPEVCNYIRSSIMAIQFHLKKKQLRQILFVIELDGKTLETLVFEVLAISNCVESDPYLVELEQNLRDFCVRLNVSHFYTNSLPEDCTFSIQLNTTVHSSLEYNEAPAFENFPYIQVNEKLNLTQSTDIIPLHTIAMDFLNLQIFITKNDGS